MHKNDYETAFGWQAVNTMRTGVTARRMFQTYADAEVDAMRTLPPGEAFDVFSYDLSPQGIYDVHRIVVTSKVSIKV